MAKKKKSTNDMQKEMLKVLGNMKDNMKKLGDEAKVWAQKGEKELTESRLHEAADKAHRLTELLRGKGYEAYEFHDRDSSMVTVGSFDLVGTPRPDGKIEIHPTIHRILETFKGTQSPLGGPLMPKQIDGIPLDVQPLPDGKRHITTDLCLGIFANRLG